MNRLKYVIFVFFILVGTSVANGQVSVTASCKYSTVPLGTSFQVVYAIKGGSATNLTPPAFTNFSVNGQFQSTSIYNGNVSTTVTYTLTPTSVGKFTIDAAKAKVGDSWISSNTLTIEVTSGGSAVTSKSSTTTKSSSTTSTAATADASSGDVFMKAVIDKTNPYVGEQVIVTYKLYYKIPLYQYGIDKLPSFSGFWSEEITKANDNAVQYYETIGGSKYAVAEIRKVALFPQKSGSLKIDPLDVECVVQVQSKQQINDPFANFFNDPFFNNFGGSAFTSYSNVKKTISSNSLTLSVKALPVANQPAEFTGSVGKFTVDATIDKTDVKTNDAITLTYKVTGTGNISLIDKPAFDFPADLETYDPDTKENIIPTTAGISGSKTFKYLIIPRSAGDFTIKPVDFCYFDLSKGAYVTLTSPEFKIKVAKGSGDDNTAVTSANKEDIKYLNSDVRYIKNNSINLTEIGKFFYCSPLFFGLLLAPVFLFFFFVILYRKKLKENSNLALVRNKKATSVARKRMNTANVFLKENKKEPFLDEVFKALWGYVSDKLNIPLADLSKETVNEKFVEKNVNEDIAQQFITTLNNCEYARFAPEDGTVTIAGIYNEAIDIITKMEKELK